MQNNRPKKGSTIKVAPIRKVKDIKAIKAMLSDKPRDLALFTIGINTNLRASDLTRITIGQVQHLKPNESFELKERKTGKNRCITLNKACIKAVQELLSCGLLKDLRGKAPLLQSNKGGALKVSSVHKLVKGWCKAINLRGNYGSHTLRKTFGYQQRVQFGVGLPELMVCFNHSSQKQTLDYLCIQPEEIKNIYENEI